MLRPRARWIVKEIELGTADVRAAAERLADKLGIGPLLARLLVVRGQGDPEAAAEFLYAGIERLHSPFEMDGMERAVARIRTALERGERIRIYGDYDADGVCATAMWVRLLKRVGADFDFYVPHRVSEGYGLNVQAIDDAAGRGVRLILTVDTGISAVEEIEYAKALGIDVVVTDHHEPPPVLPDAWAVVDPKKPGCRYPFRHLAGVGVAWKTAQALLGEPPLEWIDLVAVGTVADVVPLIGENRILVREGLRRFGRSENAGLRALLSAAGVSPDRAVTERDLAFVLAPRINAGGRMDHADVAVRLLATDDPTEAAAAAEHLESLNRERQLVAEETLRLAAEQWLGRPYAAAVVAAGEGWNAGVLGIVAAKLLDMTRRPTFVLAIDPHTGIAKGSARSLPGFDLYRALTECADLLEEFGGHELAAGLAVRAERLPELRERLERLAGSFQPEESKTPSTVAEADLVWDWDAANREWLLELEKLAPFGTDNPVPRFQFTGVRVADRRTVGKDGRHVKLVLAPDFASDDAPGKESGRISAVGFGMAESFRAVSPLSRPDLLAEWSVNEWNGRRVPEVIIRDVGVPHVQVFDWRQEALPEKLPELASSWVDAGRRQALIAFDRREAQAVAERLTGFGVSVWTADGEPVAPDDKSSLTRWEDCVDLWLYDVPPETGVLRRTLSRWRCAERLYVSFVGCTALSEFAAAWLEPAATREPFRKVYGALLNDAVVPMEELAGRCGLDETTIRWVVDVFGELGFIRLTDSGHVLRVPNPVRRNLSESAAYRNRLQLAKTAAELAGMAPERLAAVLLNWIPKRTDREERSDGFQIVHSCHTGLAAARHPV